MEYIKDTILGDYYIVLDEYNFSAYKVITPDSGIPYDHCVGHYKNLSSALKQIADNTMKGKTYDSIKQYISEYKSILNKFNENFL